MSSIPSSLCPGGINHEIRHVSPARRFSSLTMKMHNISKNGWLANTNKTSGCFVESNLFEQSAVSSAPSSLKSGFSGEQCEIEGTLRHAQHDSANNDVIKI